MGQGEESKKKKCRIPSAYIYILLISTGFAREVVSKWPANKKKKKKITSRGIFLATFLRLC